MTGQLVGHYRVLEKIGSGGMGDVFRARDERLGRDVALKLIRPAAGDNPDHLRRFEQEARAAAALNHPNILAIYDVGFEGGTPYIVTELLVGKTLRERLVLGRIPLNETSDYALQIAHGLIAAHERQIVHRDLKPENLFLTNDGRIKILDFGVAKLQVSGEDRSVETLTTVTKTGSVIGTVAYMSPEQLRAKPVDHRSDIFSFGAILYEMLTGSRAFHGETQVDTMTAVLREEPNETSLADTAIPDGFQDIIRHCLEKEPEDRFQSAKDLAFAIQTLGGGTTIRSVSPAKRTLNSRLPWAIVAALALVTIALALTVLLRVPPARPSYRRLTSEAGTVYAARFGPDGQAIVYSAAWNGKPVQIFSTVGNSLLAQELNLTDANLLAVSPNNELAVVTKGTHNGQLETMDGTLARVPMAGGSPREVLSDVRWADWNAKNELAVVHYVDGHSRLEFPIGNVLCQSGGWISDVRFSPKGDRIAFMDHPALWDDRGVVAVVDLAGHVQSLTHEWESEAGLAWRNSSEIWFSAVDKGNNLNLMAVNLSGEMRTLLDLPIGVRVQDIAADGRVLVSLNSKRLQMAFTVLGNRQDTDLSWHDWDSARDISRDGHFVLSEDASEAAGPNYAVVLRNVNGALPMKLGDGSAGSLSPDGKWALSMPLKDAAQLTLLPTGVGQPQSVHVTGVDHIHSGWSRFLPDGKRVIVNGNDTGHAPRCYLVNLSSGKAVVVSPDGVICGPVSPDGQSFVGKGANYSLTIYSFEGAASRPLRVSSNFVPVQWSEDEAALYGYHMGELPSRVYRVEIATGKETILDELRPGAPAGVVIVGPIIVSRDGKEFAYTYNQTLSVLYLISGLK